MPRISPKGYKIRRVITNRNTPYLCERFELLGRPSVFGRLVRKYFVTKKAAEEWAEETIKAFRNLGSRAAELTEVQRAELVQAFDLLDRRTDLLTAVRFYLKHVPKSEKLTTQKAAEEFLVTRGVTPKEFASRLKWRPAHQRNNDFGGYSNRHRLSLTSKIRKFCAAFGKLPIHTIALRKDEVQAYLTKCYSNPQSLRNLRAGLHSFFSWCIEKGYCSENPAKSWTEHRDQMRRYQKGKKPGILTPIQLGSLLAVTQKLDFELLPYIVLGAFSGIRPEELQRFTWDNIRPNMIHLPAEITKTRDARDIPIHPTLAKWLAIIPRGTGLMVPANAMRRRSHLWRISQCADPTNPTEAELAGCLKWPADALRHSFGSYRYAEIKSIDQVSAEMRHEDSRTFRKHYLNRGVTDEDAVAYWGLLPE